MKAGKKLWNLFHSMKCAVFLLVILAVVCTAGSLIPQNEVAAYYTTVYPEAVGHLILFLGLDHMFTVWWFILTAALLCLNLLLCSILRFPQLRKRYEEGYGPELVRKQDWAAGTGVCRWEWKPKAEGSREAVFTAGRFKKIQTEAEETVVWHYAVKNRFGIWGSWICHLGMLAVIVGFGLGQYFMLDTYVYGVAGQEKEVKEAGVSVRIDDFQVALREDYTVEQYRSELTVKELASGELRQGVTQVNSPMSAFGMDFFQNSTGWAADVAIYKDGERIETALLCQGEVIGLEEIPLSIQLTAFYPDYYVDGNGPGTRSPQPNNPVAVYSLYYRQELLAMEAIGIGLPIDVDAYRFVFENPRKYTLIQVVKDPTMWYVAAGGFLMLAGIFLAFFCRPEELWMREEKGQCEVFCRSLKGADLFADRVRGWLEEHGECLP
ncbi:MAG: cytochrome c biogenesis protein ResB [Lachnospiraceae bacterium]|nr:cytochrome c biogenesis protein ResB [Lachnospiraceae bacterium]